MKSKEKIKKNNINIEFISSMTLDGLKLKGVHWITNKKNTCIVFTPGMSGNIIEDDYPEMWGEYFAKNNIGFLYGHNRGYNHINEIEVLNKKNEEFETKKFGAVYEKFEESIYDVDLWVKKAIDLGYQNIVLMGHSLGCNKNIFYLNKNKNYSNIIGIVLASPPDIVGMMKTDKFQPNYSVLLKEANKLIKNNSNQLMQNLTWDWYNLSPQTFLNMIEDNSSIDIFPLIRNPDKFEYLETIQLPILCFLAEDEDNIIFSPQIDLELLQSKAKKCKSFTWKVFENTGHCYENKEIEVAETIVNWVKELK